jgi:hydrogenase nickel incorporation protein HypA/HybF
MHEFSLMASIMDTIKETAVQNNIARVTKVKLVIGKLSMVLPDSMQFAFEALGKDDMFTGAVLEFEERNISCQCSTCQHLFEVDRSYRFSCPQCGCTEVEVITGRELYIDYFEGDKQ